MFGYKNKHSIQFTYQKKIIKKSHELLLVGNEDKGHYAYFKTLIVYLCIIKQSIKTKSILG